MAKLTKKKKKGVIGLKDLKIAMGSAENISDGAESSWHWAGSWKAAWRHWAVMSSCVL
jgi:hypothetical protein